MKLNGTFVLREVAGDYLVIPVGESALEFNGMMILNPVSKVIWECLEKGAEKEEILETVLEVFDVELTVAEADIDGFLADLKRENLLA